MWMRLLRWLLHFAKQYNARGYRSSYPRGKKRLLMQAAVLVLNGASNEGLRGSAGFYPILAVASRQGKLRGQGK